MARRGRYGQLPSAAPNLTSTIIAIARQMEADRESTLMDAWKNGGLFEGKPVTDEMVLAFWQDRLKGVDKNDPQYDIYKNTISQTEYTVAESKMSTWYAQSPGGPKDDRRMASFYTTWANKIPKDSEFYRVLQRDGAQFIRSAIAKEKVLAHAGGGGGGGGSGKLTKAQLKAKVYNDAQTATFVAHEQLGAFLTNTLTSVAKGRGLIGEGDSQKLSNFDPNDPASMVQALDQITNHPDAVVYYTNGGAVTGQAILDVIKKLDPHFDGKLTTDYYGRALASQLTGQQTRLDLATSTGHKGDITATKKLISSTTELGRESNAWPIEQAYQQLRNNWLKTWQDPTATPDQKMASWTTYQHGLVGLAYSKTRPPDQNTQTRLLAEVNGDGSVDSLAESFSGQQSSDHSTVNGGTKGDIADTHASVASLFNQQEAVKAGQAVWAMGVTGSDGVFHPGAGKEIGAANPADVQAASPEGAIRVWLTQSGGAPIQVWVAGKSVTASVVDANGFKVGATNPDSTKVATAYDVTIDGQATRIYGYQASNGVQMYTTEAPWGPNVQMHDTGGAIQLTVKLAGIPTEQSVGKDGNFTLVRDANGKVTNITVDPGAFVLTETDPARALAGPDPHVDSMSPSIAYYLGSPQAKSELASLSGDAGFQHTVELDLRLASGAQYDPATGTVLGGDPAIYNEGAAQAGFAGRMNDPRATGMGPAGGEVFFSRSDTRGTFGVGALGQAAAANHGPNGAAVPDVRAPASMPSVLPSDQARGTAFNGLANAFQPGTNRFLPAAGEPKNGLTITTPTTLRVPAAPAAGVSSTATIHPAPLPVQPPLPVPAVPTPPGPTDRVTPMPVAPTPFAAPTRPGGGDVTSGTGTSTYGATPTATPKPAGALPKPLPTKSGQRPA